MDAEMTKEEFDAFVPISQECEGKPGVWSYKPVEVGSIKANILNNGSVTYEISLSINFIETIGSEVKFVNDDPAILKKIVETLVKILTI